ncbi:hypothetical protein RCH09_003891 [Actimicrobium sp. GrIS 1.19]|uniref:hypothetical protein n=1 Tax=Actimicrobium sp. GrIS 1.19 TaxID=3071708 RepID=UPI002DFDF1AB|nr:hypothetical protein [Actimicrobium sp. GrIS 1.19]
MSLAPLLQSASAASPPVPDRLTVADLDALAVARRAYEGAEYAAAAAQFEGVLDAHSAHPGARRGLTFSLLKAGRMDAAEAHLLGWLTESQHAVQWTQAEIERAMEGTDFDLLGKLASLHAQMRWRSRWYPTCLAADAEFPSVPRDTITVSKLRHDIGQFTYLRRLGLLDPEFDGIIATYRQLAQCLIEQDGPETRRPMTLKERALIGHVYNRMVHVPQVGRVPRALSDAWKPREVEERFLDRGEGVVVIDDFLSSQALEGLHRFAMQATVWTGIRYAYGRFGAFFNEGFNCPLLLQVAQELREALPRVITPRYPLRQMWGFKNSTDLPPAANLHADFAAVNVNFWLTPEECNADPATGGMIVYDVDAPITWDFHTYNGRTDIIKAFLRENRAKETYVSYRRNRCIMFNSDLFHGTHEVHFKPGFENHRINVTMLYGRREDDRLHQSLSSRPDLQERWGGLGSAWRSHVFSRHRR